jgi:hypothetical protein
VESPINPNLSSLVDTPTTVVESHDIIDSEKREISKSRLRTY